MQALFLQDKLVLNSFKQYLLQIKK